MDLPREFESVDHGIFFSFSFFFFIMNLGFDRGLSSQFPLLSGLRLTLINALSAVKYKSCYSKTVIENCPSAADGGFVIVSDSIPPCCLVSMLNNGTYQGRPP